MVSKLFAGVHSKMNMESTYHSIVSIIFPVEMEWDIPDQYVGRKVRTFVNICVAAYVRVSTRRYACMNSYVLFPSMELGFHSSWKWNDIFSKFPCGMEWNGPLIVWSDSESLIQTGMVGAPSTRKGVLV